MLQTPGTRSIAARSWDGVPIAVPVRSQSCLGAFASSSRLAKLNVNIDHLSLDPNIRSNEVLTDAQDALPGALTLSSVRPFYLADGAPHFLAYQAGGQTEFYRLWPSCLGWTSEAQLAAIPGATQIVTYRINDMTFALFY